MRSRDPRNTWLAVNRWRCAARRRRGGPGESAPKAKPDVIKGPFRKRGGCAMKVVGLTRGGLCGCPRMPRPAGSRGGAGRWWPRGLVLAVEKSAEAKVPAGINGRREGPNAKPRRRTPVLVGLAMNAANPIRGPGREGPTVKPEDLRAEQSPSPAAGDTAAHPAKASSCGSCSCPAGISPRRSDASSRTPVPRASTG